MTVSTRKKYFTAFAATAVLALGLHGCGGGGGDGPETGGGTMPPDEGTAEFGLTASPLASPEASSSADTLLSLADTDTAFGPVVAPVKFDRDDTGQVGVVLLEEDDSAYVESVTLRDSQGRFTIVYVINDQRAEIEFGPEHRRDSGEYYMRVNDTNLWMWNKSIGDPSYSGQVGWEAGDFRGYAATGVLTPPEHLVSLGSATYVGEIWGDLWHNYTADRYRASYDEQGNSVEGIEGFIRGELTLDATFSESGIEGSVSNLMWRRSYSAQWTPYEDTNTIRISEGEIIDNWFHAAWHGEDNSVSSAPEDSVSGFEGSMLGEFYGPQGEEVGGVLTGQRESTNQIINGVFGAERQQ